MIYKILATTELNYNIVKTSLNNEDFKLLTIKEIQYNVLKNKPYTLTDEDYLILLGYSDYKKEECTRDRSNYVYYRVYSSNPIINEKIIEVKTKYNNGIVINSIQDNIKIEYNSSKSILTNDELETKFKNLLKYNGKNALELYSKYINTNTIKRLLDIDQIFNIDCQSNVNYDSLKIGARDYYFEGKLYNLLYFITDDDNYEFDLNSPGVYIGLCYHSDIDSNINNSIILQSTSYKKFKKLEKTNFIKDVGLIYYMDNFNNDLHTGFNFTPINSIKVNTEYYFRSMRYDFTKELPIVKYYKTNNLDFQNDQTLEVIDLYGVKTNQIVSLETKNLISEKMYKYETSNLKIVRMLLLASYRLNNNQTLYDNTISLNKEMLDFILKSNSVDLNKSINNIYGTNRIIFKEENNKLISILNLNEKDIKNIHQEIGFDLNLLNNIPNPNKLKEGYVIINNGLNTFELSISYPKISEEIYPIIKHNKNDRNN